MISATDLINYVNKMKKQKINTLKLKNKNLSFIKLHVILMKFLKLKLC